MNIDREEQRKAIREGLSRKANNLLEQMLKTDHNGHQRQATTQPTAPLPERTPEERIAEIDSLLAVDPGSPNEQLHALRDRLMATVSPGSGDGGAREPLPAPTLQEQADAALAAGDAALSISLKSQQLSAIVAEQNGVKR